MSLRPFSYDPLTGTRVLYEDTPDGFRLHSTQDAEPILDHNDRLRSLGRSYYAADPNFWHIASIPNNVLLHWAIQDGVPPDMVFSDEYADRVAKRLNCSDFRKLKTADVTV